MSVGTRVAAVGVDRYLMEHRVVSHRLGKVAAEGDVLIVAYDYRAGEQDASHREPTGGDRRHRRARTARDEGLAAIAERRISKIDLGRSPLHRVESVSRGRTDSPDTTTSEAVAG